MIKKSKKELKWFLFFIDFFLNELINYVTKRTDFFYIRGLAEGLAYSLIIC